MARHRLNIFAIATDGVITFFAESATADLFGVATAKMRRNQPPSKCGINTARENSEPVLLIGERLDDGGI